MSFTVSVYPHNQEIDRWVLDVDVAIDQNYLRTTYPNATVEISIPSLNFKQSLIVSQLTNYKNTRKLLFLLSTKNLGITDLNEILWWPNGFGEQKLFELKLQCTINGVSQTKTDKIGFRKVELIQENVSNIKEHGLTFYFKINNRPVYLKGSNWIPADSFQEKITPDYLNWLMYLAKDANMNSKF